MHLTTRRPLAVVVAVLALLLGACAGGTDGTSADGTGTTDGDAATNGQTDDGDATDDADDGDAAMEATVAVASSDLGDIIVDADGRTLYMFVPDEGGEPTCTDACAETWPVFEGPATAGDGTDQGLLSTATHPSGATQVTYGGWPLYHFANDAAPGDTNGQGVNDVWFVIGPDGEPIRDAAAAGDQDRGY